MFKRFSILAMGLSLASLARADGLYLPPPPTPPIVAEIARAENARPLVLLSAVWSEVRRSLTPEEAVYRIQGRFGPMPLVFRGTEGPAAVPTTVIINRVYQRRENEVIQLPAVSFDLLVSRPGFSDKRTITIPLAANSGSLLR
jgi:hypothetical protein